MAALTLIMAILATYRLAHLLPEDDGPLFVFTRIRNYFFGKAVLAYCVANSVKDEDIEIVFNPDDITKEMLLAADNIDLGVWINIYRGITCPYCMGIYASILVGLLVIWNNYYGNAVIMILAIAGGQSFLQRFKE